MRNIILLMLAMVPLTVVSQVALNDETRLGFDLLLTDGTTPFQHLHNQWYKWTFNGAGDSVRVEPQSGNPSTNVILRLVMDGPEVPDSDKAITFSGSGPKLVVIGTDDVRMGQVFDLKGTGIKAIATIYVRFVMVTPPGGAPSFQTMEFRFSN